MKALIFFLIGSGLIYGGYAVLPKAGDTNAFSIGGLSQKTMAVMLFILGGIIFTWGFFKIEWEKI